MNKATKIFALVVMTLAIVVVSVADYTPITKESGGGSTYLIYVSPNGSDSNSGSQVGPYLTIAKAMSAVTSTRKTIILDPGTYTTSTQIEWPTNVSDILITGISADYESTIIENEAEDTNSVINIAPAGTASTANFLAFFANLTIEAADTMTGVTIDNTGMTTSGKKLIVTFRDCGFGNDTDTDKSVYTIHDDATSLIKIYMHGRGFGGNNIEGLVYIDPANAGDRFKANGMNFEGGVQFGTDAVACENEFYGCVMALNGGSGGDDVQILRANGCISRDGMTQAAAALGEFADNADEAFLSF